MHNEPSEFAGTIHNSQNEEVFFFFFFIVHFATTRLVVVVVVGRATDAAVATTVATAVTATVVVVVVVAVVGVPLNQAGKVGVVESLEHLAGVRVDLNHLGVNLGDGRDVVVLALALLLLELDRDTTHGAVLDAAHQVSDEAGNLVAHAVVVLLEKKTSQ